MIISLIVLSKWMRPSGRASGVICQGLAAAGVRLTSRLSSYYNLQKIIVPYNLQFDFMILMRCD